MIRRPPRSTLDRSSAASDVYKRQLPCTVTYCPPQPAGKQVLKGYRVSANYEVKLRGDNFDKAGDIIGGIADKGATNVSGLTFKVDNEEGILEGVRSEAIAEARAKAEAAGVSDRGTFLQQDLFTADLSAATVIAMYLLPAINEKLAPTFRALRPGTRIVSHYHDMGDWEPEQKIEVGGHWIFLWTVPRR